jgi:hypothetical protein
MTHIVVIPTDTAAAVQVHNVADLDEARRLTFGGPGKWFDFISFPVVGFQIAVDDEGAVRDPREPLNHRAMILAMHHGYNAGQPYPLYGPAALLGIDGEDWVDVPEAVVVQVGVIATLPAFAARAAGTVRHCRVCGCTDELGCLDPDTHQPCSWIAADLCSACGSHRPLVQSLS